MSVQGTLLPLLNTVVLLYHRSDHHANCSLKRRTQGHRQNKGASDIPNRVWKLLPCSKLQVFSPSFGKHPNLFHPFLLLAREIPTPKSKDLLGRGCTPTHPSPKLEFKAACCSLPRPGSGPGSFIPSGPHLAAQTVSPGTRDNLLLSLNL